METCWEGWWLGGNVEVKYVFFNLFLFFYVWFGGEAKFEYQMNLVLMSLILISFIWEIILLNPLNESFKPG